MRTRTGLLLAGLAVLTLASGCTGNSAGDMAAVGRAPQPEHGAAAKAAPATATAPGTAGQARQLARTAQLAMTAPDVGGAAAQARQIAVTAGGYSGSEQTDPRSATLTLAVPSDSLDDVLARLSKLGQVTSTQQSAADVTDQVVDVESRLETARRSVDRVRALLDRATSLSDITSIESQLTTRESDLESLQARQKSLTTTVTLATLTLTVTPTPAPPLTPQDPGFLTGLTTGWNGFQTFGAASLHVLGAALPFLLILGIPLTALIWLWRRRTRTPHQTT
ncbi:DUF4349 domain-containing protein [Amycolatopsis sp. GM8]|uniref:DUF4349 domain-containing protein n=1 Tax=Amycolatopsis sp. GM8 TaxID=2896530 RepID=UPI001F38243A|nr:DUF4349 domain-containing protein [Amycolatopsis sp. GM8]